MEYNENKIVLELLNTPSNMSPAAKIQLIQNLLESGYLNVPVYRRVWLYIKRLLSIGTQK